MVSSVRAGQGSGLRGLDSEVHDVRDAPGNGDLFGTDRPESAFTQCSFENGGRLCRPDREHPAVGQPRGAGGEAGFYAYSPSLSSVTVQSGPLSMSRQSAS